MARLKSYLRNRKRLRTAVLAVSLLVLLAGLRSINLLFHLNEPQTPIAPADITVEGVVQEVIDGDSLKLENAAQVRLKGIDTPEYGALGHEQARDALSGLVQSRVLYLAYDGGEERDRFGRLLAYISTKDGLDVNRTLIERGFAWIYRMKPSHPLREPYLAAQQTALSEGRGFWSRLKQDSGPFFSSRFSSVFHRAGCPYGEKIATENRITLIHLLDAFEQGLSPCRECITQPLEGR